MRLEFYDMQKALRGLSHGRVRLSGPFAQWLGIPDRMDGMWITEIVCFLFFERRY